MIVALARKLFGSSNEPRIKTYMPRVAQINALEKDLEKLSDDALRGRTEAFPIQGRDPHPCACGHDPALLSPGAIGHIW
jgi:preprotein translocase subunit SecA